MKQVPTSILDEVIVMAPAGNWEALAAALQGGADAVYFGVGALNMRAGGNVNFTEEELPLVVARCHEAGSLAYLTVNTVVYEEELATLERLVWAAKQAGVDAVIVSDQAAIEAAYAVGLPVHLSTQLSISNSRTVRFYGQWAEAVVLARELTLEQVAAVHSEIMKQSLVAPNGKPIQIELFCHGALCMAISGKCYLSLHDCNRSANRGECIQICRRSYLLTDADTGAEIRVENPYLMSPKDLCTIDILDKIIASGVTILKIEGRARSAEYVKVVTQCYKEAVQALAAGTYNDETIAGWKERLATVFNRGFWHGHYLGQRAGEWSTRYGSSATERKHIAGRIKNFFKQIHVADIAVEGDGLRVGDRLYVMGETTGVLESTVEEIRQDDRPVEYAAPGTRCSIPLQGLARRGDRIFVRIPQEEA